MKRHLTLSTTSQHGRNEATTVEAIANRTRASAGATSVSDPVRGHVAHRASARVWKHTLILTGTLNADSAHELEEEIECLCQEGVEILTLDLRHLDEIDDTGVTAIASCGGACEMEGRDFAVIPGGRLIQRALTEGGAGEFLTPDPSASLARRFSASSSDIFADMTTAMIKSL